MRRALSATLWLCAFTAINLSAETLQVTEDNAPVMRGKNVVAKLAKGTRINVLVRKGNWLGVKVKTPDGEKQGWVNAKYLGPVVEVVPLVAVPVEAEPVQPVQKPVQPKQKPVQESSRPSPPQQAKRPQVNEILSTGLPAKSVEETLPGGAILHLKIHSGDKLIDAVEKLVKSLLPDKMVPPPFQPMLKQARPLLAFVGMQMGGQPLTLDQASQMLGIDLARPLTLSIYPQQPDKWFVLSIPVANRKAFSGLLMGMLRPRSIELTGGQDQTYHIQPMKRNMPRNLFAVSSDDTVFISGSPELAKMLYVTQAGASLANDPLILKTAQKYATRDISLVINPAFVKPMLPMLAKQFPMMKARGIKEFRRGLERDVLNDRQFRMAMRRVFRVRNFTAILDTLEVLLSATAETLFGFVMEHAQSFDGIGVAIDLEGEFQRFEASLFSKLITPEGASKALDMAAILKAMDTLPGERTYVRAVGRKPKAEKSKLVEDWLQNVAKDLNTRELPLEWFEALATFVRSLPASQDLESRTDWVVSTALSLHSFAPTADIRDLEKYMEYLKAQASAGPTSSRIWMFPGNDQGLVQQHFQHLVDSSNASDQAFRKLLKGTKLENTLYKKTSRLRVEDMQGRKRYMVEDSLVTSKGFFGYSQHELINRTVYSVMNKNGYTLFYTDAVDGSVDLMARPPKSSASIKKLAQLGPKGAHHFEAARTLHLLSSGIDLLGSIEDVAHRELNDFLKKAAGLAKEDKLNELQEEDYPLYVMSVNKDTNTGEYYLGLLGDLTFPRPKVTEAVKEIFEGYSAKADQIGGAALFVRTLPGEKEFVAIQSIEALSVLLKTAGNKIFEQYLDAGDGAGLSPRAMQQAQGKIKARLSAPRDFKRLRQEVQASNPRWAQEDEREFNPEPFRF